jgi:hypothetical protein
MVLYASEKLQVAESDVGLMLVGQLFGLASLPMENRLPADVGTNRSTSGTLLMDVRYAG